MSLAPSLPPPDFEAASAYPEVAWLHRTAAAADLETLRRYVDGLPPGTGRAFAVRTVAEVPGVEHVLRELVAAAPDDVFALTVLGAREVELGWQTRTANRAQDVSREQF